MDGGNRKVSKYFFFISNWTRLFLNNVDRVELEPRKSKNTKKRQRSKRVPHRRPFLPHFSRVSYKSRPMQRVRSTKRELCAHTSRLVSVKRAKSASTAMTRPLRTKGRCQLIFTVTLAPNSAKCPTRSSPAATSSKPSKKTSTASTGCAPMAAIIVSIDICFPRATC